MNVSDQRVAKGKVTMSNQADRDSVASHCSLALGIALAMFIAGGLLFLVGSAIYAACSVHWSIGVIVAVCALLVAIPEGTAEKYGDHTPW